MKRISFALVLILAILFGAPCRTWGVARRGAGHRRIGVRRASALRLTPRRASRAGRRVRRPIVAAKAYHPLKARRKARTTHRYASRKPRRAVSKTKASAPVSKKPVDLFSSLAAADKPAAPSKAKPSKSATSLKNAAVAATGLPLMKTASAALGNQPSAAPSTPKAPSLNPISEAATRRAFEEAGRSDSGETPKNAKSANPGAKSLAKPGADSSAPLGADSSAKSKGASKASGSPTDPNANPSLGNTILDLATKLALTLVIGIISIYLISKRYGATPRRSGQLHLLDSASLGPNRSVHLLRVRGKLLVIGATADRITILSELPDTGDAESELPISDASASFSDQLSLFNDSADDSEIDLKVREGNRYLKDRAASLAQSLLRKKGPLS